MPKQTKYAHERRANNRDQKRIKERIQFQAIIDEFLSFEQLQQAQRSGSIVTLFEQVSQHLDQHQYSFALKKTFYQQFRKRIIQYNHTNDADLPLPTQHLVSIQRTPLLFNETRLEQSKSISLIKEKLLRFWYTTDNFTADESIGNILICAILYGGISSLSSLQALLEHLKQQGSIDQIPKIQIPLIFLEPQSPHYGDLYDPKQPLKKSRNFVPDRLTLLWIARLKTQKIDIQSDCYTYINCIFKALALPLSPKQFNQLLQTSSHSWMQLDKVDLSPALSLCLSEEIETCGLSLSAFKRYLTPQLSIFDSQQALEPLPKILNPTEKAEQCCTDHSVDSLIALHKQILKFFRNSDQTTKELRNFLLSQHDHLPENAKRLGLWLYSLFHPAVDDMQSICRLYQLDQNKYLRYITQQQKIRHSSIYSYYTKLAESWLLHSTDFIEESNLNDRLDVIYNRMLTGIGKSKSQKIDLLKRFHQFQQMLFNAESFPLSGAGLRVHSPKAEIISGKTFQYLLSQLSQYKHSSYTAHDLEMLSIVYTIAFRTGMRINEILGMRIKDVEGVKASSIWIRPYRAKHQQHFLKTDSAERNLNVQILLSEEEHLKFQQYCKARRSAYSSNDYLFTLWNSAGRIKPYLVTTPFQKLLDAILPNHCYSFHSLRHSATNNLAMILTMNYKFVTTFTDYSHEHYNLIRSQLLRSNTPQNSWYLLAHLLGHIDPTETFRSYLHLAYLMAGYQLRKFDPLIDRAVIHKICPRLKPPQKHQIALSYYDEQIARTIKIKSITTPDEYINTAKIQADLVQAEDNDFIYGTSKSAYPFPLIAKILKKLDQSYTPQLLAQQYDFPIEQLMLWQRNIIRLKQLKNRKNRPRFIMDADKSERILPHLETAEDKSLLEYFFKQLNELRRDDANILDAIHIFETKANISHAGLIFKPNDVRLANRFLKGIYGLFPASCWQIAISSEICEEKLMERLSFNLQSDGINSSLNNSFKLELVSQKNAKALAVFRYCMLVLLIVCTPLQPDHS
ncbi:MULTISPECIES: tyrosine-type recombinase/integrase [Acinetobacter]|uniref:tyrosine-type recombinase/integrase n=2 Tax=Moraxellaceae TaxID=468 RepID=UPI0005C5BBC8|nr:MULTISPECIES: tyrosine-type recombinase/integrase [Acinetobacter]MDP7963348.1 tyrosine-type recombinase/integrase [Acinetobacter baumannii]